MPKVGHTRKACALNRSMAFLWLVVTCFCLFPSKSRWFLRVQQTSLAKAFLALLFLIRCDVSRFTGAHNGPPRFPFVWFALLTQAPNGAQIHAAKQTENARFMACLRARPAAHARKSRCQGSVLRFAAPIMARCHPSATLTRARWRGKPQKGREGFRRPCPASQGPCLASRRSQGKRSLHRTQCHKAQGKARFQSSARSH